ncbi:MAG: biotin--[acetyl-CoA-carboxylase] ligase [Myxococcota bacterium]
MNQHAAQEILAALRIADESPYSGEALSARLGVSRAQIWKHVSQLRRRGYQIEGAPGGGYRLTGSPDRLYPEQIGPGLQTQWLARTLHYLDETDSTNEDAARLAREGAPHGTAVIAEAQTAGRGRLGRDFYSPAYQNLYTSIVLRPTLETGRIPTLLLAAGLAVAQAVAETLGETAPIEIKWPNDVLIRGLKTSGVLMELEAEENRVTSAILGIGVNLNTDPAEFPEEFRESATSLASQLGQPVDRIRFTQLLYSTLEEVIDRHAEAGLEGVRSQFEAFFRMRGRRVRVAGVDGGQFEGRARGVADNGALEIETDSGQVVKVLAGDVTICKEGPNQESDRSE